MAYSLQNPNHPINLIAYFIIVIIPGIIAGLVFVFISDVNTRGWWFGIGFLAFMIICTILLFIIGRKVNRNRMNSTAQ